LKNRLKIPETVFRGLRTPYRPETADEQRFQFWTPDITAARAYAETGSSPSVLTARISIQNPFIIQTDAAARKLARLVDTRWDTSNYYSDILDAPGAHAVLAHANHDGVILDDGNGQIDHLTFVTMYARQINIVSITKNP
jgi:hypothetical protein